MPDQASNGDNTGRRLVYPSHLAAGIVLIVIAFLIAIGGSVAGSYALTLNAISHSNHVQSQLRKQQNKAAAALREREAESQIRTSIPLCAAIVQMDDAKNGATNASMSPNSYGHRLARAITKVDDASKCDELISLVHRGYTIAQITHLVQEQEKTPGR